MTGSIRPQSSSYRKPRRPALAAVFAALVLAGGLAAGTANARAGSANTPLAYGLATVGAYGGEPSITSDRNGVLYDTSPSGLPSGSAYPGSPPIYRSTNAGASWTLIQPADNNSGDDCIDTDQANSLYWCNLASQTVSTAPLQADVWKSTSGSTCTTSCNWVHGSSFLGSTACGTSCQPFGVDRQWVDSSIAPGGTTSSAEVVLMYHDFYGPSQIWVNISHDGG